MKRTHGSIVFITVFLCLFSRESEAFATDPRDIVRLKKAGVSDTVLREIVRTDSIARAFLSVDEIVEMKKVDIGDAVILSILEQGSASASELDKQEAADRAIKRRLKRQELRLELVRKEFDLLVEYVTALIANPKIVKLVHEGKIASEDYAAIVKYLKQYAREEETKEYDDQGDINIDINKIHR